MKGCRSLTNDGFYLFKSHKGKNQPLIQAQEGCILGKIFRKIQLIEHVQHLMTNF